MRKLSAISFLLVFFVAGMASAQMTAPPGPFLGFKSSDDVPVEINAGSMQADMQAGNLVFKGRVKARQGDRTIYADQMEVKYTQDGKLIKLVAIGNVKVNMGGSFATSDRLIFDNVKRVIHLVGNPRLVQGKQIIVGKKMTYDITLEKLIVDKPKIEWVSENKPENKKTSNKGDSK
jgi:lipopolysaccharide export system protein LptA